MKYNGSCDCKSVKFLIETNLEKVAQCNCSFCKRRNAIMVLEKKESIEITEGEEELTVYQFNTNIAKHHFCKTCGIYTHHQRKSDPNGIGVNIGCIDDIDSFQYDADVLDMKSK